MRLIIISEQEDGGTREWKWPRETDDRSTVSRFNPVRSPADVNFQDRALDTYARYTLHATVPLVIHAIPPDLRSAIQNESAIPSKKLTIIVNDLRRSKGMEKLREYQENITRFTRFYRKIST